MESSMKEQLKELALILEGIDPADLAETRFALYRLRVEAWAIITEIDKQALAKWEREQLAEELAPLRLEDIGL
jgi:crotonobetainyl-CoA:carnitine CoA-transferase CaiB-like acyl-CoA transferase